MDMLADLGPVRKLELPQGTIAYRDVGSGPTLVFVHGILVNGALWRNVVPGLSRRFRCVVPHLPLGGHAHPLRSGSDRSPRGVAQLLADVVAALDLRDVVLVGNDTGGALCQIAITQGSADSIARVVLTPCDAFDNFLPPMFKGLQILARFQPALTAFIQPLRLRPLRRLPLAFGWVTSQPLPRAISDSYVTPGYRGEIRRDTKKLLRAISNRHTLEAAERFGEVDKPVLVAWADGDKLFPQSLADRLAAAFPNARRETIAGSRTFIGEDQPEQLARAIDAFIADTPLAQGTARENVSETS